MPCLLCGRSLAYNWAVTRRQVAAGHSEGQCRGAGLRARAHVCTTLHHRPEEALARTHARTRMHMHAPMLRMSDLVHQACGPYLLMKEFGYLAIISCKNKEKISWLSKELRCFPSFD